MKIQTALTLGIVLAAVAAVSQPEHQKQQHEVIIVHAVPFYWTAKNALPDGSPLPDSYNWGGYEVQNVDQSKGAPPYVNPTLSAPYQLTGTNNLAQMMADRLNAGFSVAHIEGSYDLTVTLVK